MIEVDNVSFSYRSHTSDEPLAVLKDVSCSIDDGEYLAIVGCNGSGKSTLAKLFNGLLIPDSGRIRIDGFETTDPGRIWDIRSRVGVVFQNPDNQIVASVVEEDVAFAPENLGLPQQEIVRRVEESLERVELIDLRERLTHELSGGQKQRLAIAGVLAMRPRVLVLDEPTAMLDPVGREEVMRTVEELNRSEGLTVIHITHSMEEAARARRVMALASCTFAYDGQSKDFFSRSDMVRKLHLEMPSLARLAELLRTKNIDIPTGTYTVEAMARCLIPS